MNKLYEDLINLKFKKMKEKRIKQLITRAKEIVQIMKHLPCRYLSSIASILFL